VPTIRENPTEYRADSVPLLDLYKIALDEYRFEVKLNADRTIQYLTLSAIVLSAGVGLLRVGTPGRSTTFFVALIFFCGVFIALLGVMAVRRGHEYYRRTVYKKTLIENLLGLHNPVQNYSGATLAVTTTRGQGEVHEMLDHYPHRRFNLHSVWCGRFCWDSGTDLSISTLRVMPALSTLRCS
jgi:hypothetical protein